MLVMSEADRGTGEVWDRTSLAFTVEGPRGYIGTVGAIPTNLLLNEYFIWFKPSKRIGRTEIAALAEKLQAVKEYYGARLWITTAETPALRRWAKMLGFTEDGLYNDQLRWRM